MNKLPKEKRDQLILVVLGTIGAMAGIWFGLVRFQKDKLKEISVNIDSTQQKIDRIQKVAHDADRVEASLKESSAKLDQAEAMMPSGDIFSWMVTRIRQFNNPSMRVDMPQIGLPTEGDVLLIPVFPYQQATLAVAGTAYFQDIGHFLAEFENAFPYMRVQNLMLEPGGGASAEEREKLNFRMEIVTLTKSTKSSNKGS